jgi:hypothetical protein
MGLHVIGAGVGRTGTGSLKLALQQLLGAPCYHMYEVLKQPHHTPIWQAAVRGESIDWETIYANYAATVDWPGAAFWKPLSQAFPDAFVLLSLRSTAQEWFRSANETINELLQVRRMENADLQAWRAMAKELLRRTFSPIPFEQAAAEAAYERHNAEVRATIPPERLLEWQVTDGWEPLCDRLGVPVPAEPFPHVNKRDEFQAMLERGTQQSSWRTRWRRLVRATR